MTLVDTGPLVALCDPRDGLHRQALLDLRNLSAGGLRACEAVITEAVFHLAHPIQRRRLALLLDELDIDSLQTADPDFRDEAFAWLEKYGDHQPDWADACLAVLCGRDRALKVWTYDREFRTTWRKPDGRAIALAIKS